MMMTLGAIIGVLCVDDNPQVAEALRLKLDRTVPFEWLGTLTAADGVVAEARRRRPRLVILDLDMPGRDPFEAAAELSQECPDARVVVFSGHIRKDLVDRALDAGVWGYVSKNDGEDALLTVLRDVVAGEVGFSPEVRATCNMT